MPAAFPSRIFSFLLSHLFTSNIRLFLKTLPYPHWPPLSPCTSWSLSTRPSDKGTLTSTPTVRRQIIVSGHGGLSGVRGQRWGRNIIIMRSLFCQQFSNEAGRDREFHHLRKSCGGVVVVVARMVGRDPGRGLQTGWRRGGNVITLSLIHCCLRGDLIWPRRHI